MKNALYVFAGTAAVRVVVVFLCIVSPFLLTNVAVAQTLRQVRVETIEVDVLASGYGQEVTADFPLRNPVSIDDATSRQTGAPRPATARYG